MKPKTVADTALFCSLLLGIGILIGVFGAICAKNYADKRLIRAGENMVGKTDRKPQPRSRISYHTDDAL